MRLPSVSVVIPVRNCETYLAEAITSVLRQTVPPAEVLVVDDGCTDSSPEIAASFGLPVTLLRRVPGGSAPAARNLGVQHATGEWLAFLDADDTWAPERLERQLAGGVDADLRFGYVEEFHSPELSAQERQSLPPARGVVPGRVITTLLVARETFLGVGSLDESLAAADFLDWLARARADGLSEVMIDAVIAGRRLHPNNTSWDSRPQDLLRTLRASLARGERG